MTLHQAHNIIFDVTAPLLCFNNDPSLWVQWSPQWLVLYRLHPQWLCTLGHASRLLLARGLCVASGPVCVGTLAAN